MSEAICLRSGAIVSRVPALGIDATFCAGRIAPMIEWTLARHDASP